MKLYEADFHIEKLRLAPGDIAVLSTDLPLTKEQASELLKRFQEAAGAQNKVLVLTSGLKVAALTRAEIEALAR